MKTIELAKYHGTGNDFLVTMADAAAPLRDADVVALCDRHRGVGADGLIELGPPAEGADCSMRLRNADGGDAQMSGNGIRALAAFAARHGYGTDARLAVSTAAGVRTLDLVRDEHGRVVGATVDMGPVTFDSALIPVNVASPFELEATVHGTVYCGDAAGMGNPHFVVFVDEPQLVRVATHGAALERDARFPDRTNVEFVTVDDDGALRLRVFERGVGEPLSCGTGACASAAVARRRGLIRDHVLVRVPGGELTVELGETIRLGGPVQHVFDVSVDLDELGGRA
jgi:diaminopimelate epimerase